MKILSWLHETLASPSGRASGRRLAFLWVVNAATLVGVWMGLTGGDVASGVLSLLGLLLGVTGTAVTAGRFAERGSESMPQSVDVEERRRQ